MERKPDLTAAPRARRLIRVLGLAAACAWGVFGPAAPIRAQDPAQAPQRHLVGSALELRGRVDAVWVGAADAPTETALRRLATLAAPRGLDLHVARNDSLDEADGADLVAVDAATARDQVRRIAELATAGRAVVLVVAGSDALGPSHSSAKELRRDEPWSGFARVRPVSCAPASGASGVVGVADPASDPGQVVLEALRAVVRAAGERYLSSVFAGVTARRVGSRIDVDVRTLLSGRVTRSVVGIDGTIYVPEGPLGPFEVSAIASRADAVLRLRFDGAGVTDDRAVQLASVLRSRATDLRVDMGDSAWFGQEATLRAMVRDGDGRPVADATVSAQLEGSVAAASDPVATTDAFGVALLRVPVPIADPAAAAGRMASFALDVSVDDGWGRRTWSTELVARPRPELVIQTDRARYRPGETVHVRAFRFDAAGHVSPGVDVELDLRDGRGHAARSFQGVTDGFGAVTFTLPLDVAAATGTWRLLGRGATLSFDVESAPREPFDVRLVVDHDALAPGEPIHGHVEAFEWDGAPLGDVMVAVSAGREESARLRGTGELAFELPAAACEVSRGGVTLVARVTAAARVAQVTRRVSLDRGALDVVAPPVVWAGTSLAVTVRAAGGGAVGDEAGIVDANLLVRGRLVATASARLDGGAAPLALLVPAGADGMGFLEVRRRGDDTGIVVRPVVVSALDVELSVPSSAAPGESVPLGVRVHDGPDGTGAAVPALLDVRVGDAALGAAPLLDPLAPRRRGPSELHALALRPLTGAAFSDRARDAARDLLARAAAIVVSGEPLDLYAPWGARVHIIDDGDGPAVAVELLGARWGGVREGMSVASRPLRDVRIEALPLAFVPAPNPFHVDYGSTNDWVARHRAPDGGWDAVSLDSCCANGPRGFRVGATSLALLGYLGEGETQQSGPYRDVVRDGLAWLRVRQGDDGFVGDRTGQNAVFQHALAATSLSEAYGMTSSRALLPSAQSAVDALVALQRDDGGFGEDGQTSPGVLLTTVACMALKSARMAEMRVDDAAWRSLAAWAERNSADPHLTAEEIAALPFGSGHPRRTAAACLFLARLLTGTPQDADGMDRLIDRVAADPPTEEGFEADEPFSVYISTQAAFKAGGDAFGGGKRREVWKLWNEALKPAVVDALDPRKDTCSYGSAPSSGPAGRFLTTCLANLCLDVYYRFSRVFGDPHGEPPVRASFDVDAFRDLGIATDAEGAARFTLPLPDQLTTWNIAVGAFDARGRYGAALSEVVATLPLRVYADVPPRLRKGDVVRVPLTLRSSLDADATCSLDVTVSGGLELVEPMPATVTVPAAGSLRVAATVRATAAGHGSLTVRLSQIGGEGHGDAVTRRVEIEAVDDVVPSVTMVPVGSPVALPAPGATATLRIRTSSLGMARSSLAALIRRPTGCFEQTSATLVPAHLAWRLLGAESSAADAELLREGVQRLYGFEAADGGFALFPEGAPRADLTALGIHELLDLADVAPPDPLVLERAGAYLSGNLPERGVARLLAVSALRRVGRGGDIVVADPGDDPYLLATAVNLGLLDETATRAAVARLGESVRRERTASTAFWSSTTWAPFTDRAATVVETTGAAVLALAERGGDAEVVAAGAEFLRRHARADGAWSTTRDTVAALRALAAVQDRARPTRLAVAVGDAAPVDLDSSGDLVEYEVPAWTSGATLRLVSDADVWAQLVVRSPGASAAAAPGALSLFVQWPAAALSVGELRPLDVRFANTSEDLVHAPTVEVPLPCGATVDPYDLRAVAGAAGLAYAEVRDGRLIFYGESLAPGAEMAFEVPLLLRYPGTFATGTAVAYAYYDPERRSAVPSSVLSVASPR